jgi:hypothetical protein
MPSGLRVLNWRVSRPRDCGAMMNSCNLQCIWAGSPSAACPANIERPAAGPGLSSIRRTFREDVCERLIDAAHLDTSEVTVSVHEGHVLLEGTVIDRRMRYEIEDVSAAAPGVTDVDNRIKVLRSA